MLRTVPRCGGGAPTDRGLIGISGGEMCRIVIRQVASPAVGSLIKKRRKRMRKKKHKKMLRRTRHQRNK